MRLPYYLRRSHLTSNPAKPPHSPSSKLRRLRRRERDPFDSRAFSDFCGEPSWRCPFERLAEVPTRLFSFLHRHNPSGQYVVCSLISELPVGISNQEQFALRIGCEGTDSKREGRALCRQASSRLKRGGESGKGVRATAMGNDDLPSISVSPTLLLVAEVEETIRFLHKVRTRLPPTAPNARQVRVHVLVQQQQQQQRCI